MHYSTESGSIRKLPLKKLLFIILVASCSVSAALGNAVAEHGGHAGGVHTAHPSKRIISLSPALTEMAFDIGAGRSIVGTMAYSNYPPAARRIPVIGDAFHLDMERILSLRPDLVLAWEGGTPGQIVQRLRKLKIPVISIGGRRLDDIADNLLRIGAITGHKQQARESASKFLHALSALRIRYRNTKPLRVFYQISALPLYTVGGSQIISQAITLCGGRNIFESMHELAPVVSTETVLARRPQVIVTGSSSNYRGGLAAWRKWPELPAVWANNLFSIDADLFTRATPRMLQGISILCTDLALARKHLGIGTVH